MLFPKKVKYRKWQTARKNPAKMVRADTRGISIDFGSYGLKAETMARVTSAQIESARKAMVRHLTKEGKTWIRIFPDRPVTAKAAEVGMGKGKGDLKGYCFEVHPGRIIFEADGATPEICKEALRKAGTNLPVKTRVVARNK